MNAFFSVTLFHPILVLTKGTEWKIKVFFMNVVPW